MKAMDRLFRSPPIFFALAPIYIFWGCRLNSPSFILKYAAVIASVFGCGGSVLVWCFLLGQYGGAVVGTMLFHLQHQVNVGYWRRFSGATSAMHVRRRSK
jgi:hypothetical protein